jgi:hypothetical protein
MLRLLPGSQVPTRPPLMGSWTDVNHTSLDLLFNSQAHMMIILYVEASERALQSTESISDVRQA